MSRPLDLYDIQGNIVRAYGRFGFPHARYFFFHVAAGAVGRAFVRRLEPFITTAERWEGGPDDAQQGGVPRPQVTLNLGFSWRGLEALDMPTETLAQMPREYIDGMARRSSILRDVGPSGYDHWDTIWQRSFSDPDYAVHIWVAVAAQMQPDGTPVPDLDDWTDWLRSLADATHGGVVLLSGHGPTEEDYQQAGSRLEPRGDGTMRASRKEHFGFVDGIGNPVFAGQFAKRAEQIRVRGRGKIMPDQSWRPIATGEFLLGHVDESQELPIATQPARFMQNGTFMAFRKLHEDVPTFLNYLADQSEIYARVMHVSLEEAAATLRAKMVGRWANGAPLMNVPTYQDMLQFEKDWADIPELLNKGATRTKQEEDRLDTYRRLLIDFKYRHDQVGVKCPITAHIRRANVRDMLDPRLSSKNPRDWDGSALSNRRRILRRGLPYGSFDPDHPEASEEHGIIFIACCADLKRQFEFVLQQWINYGMDVNSGNDTCPVIGPHATNEKFIIPADKSTGGQPYVMNAIKQFVTTRGGEYFFMPSITVIRMIGAGMVDPT